MATTVTISPGQLGMFIKSSARKNADAVRMGIKRAAYRSIALLAKNTPVDQGILKNAWKVIVGQRGDAKVVNDAPHAGIVEKGARPHMPPLEPILEWVKRHLRGFGVKAPKFRTRMGPLTAKATARSNASFARHLGDVAEFDREVLEIAEAIRWKIFKFGQAGTRFVERSLPEIRDFVEEEINKAISKSLANQAG